MFAEAPVNARRVLKSGPVCSGCSAGSSDRVSVRGHIVGAAQVLVKQALYLGAKCKTIRKIIHNNRDNNQSYF